MSAPHACPGCGASHRGEFDHCGACRVTMAGGVATLDAGDRVRADEARLGMVERQALLELVREVDELDDARDEEAWVKFAAGAMVGGPHLTTIAESADDMLAELRKRRASHFGRSVVREVPSTLDLSDPALDQTEPPSPLASSVTPPTERAPAPPVHKDAADCDAE